MAIIVDKVQKRKDIALACKDIFCQNGINNLTISQIAKVANVGKGTLYEYFKNKEDIIFEIVNIMMLERNKVKHKKLKELSSTREKIKEFSRFFYDDAEKELRKLYKEFISISLVNPDKEMIGFQSQCTLNYQKWFEEIFDEGIEKNEIIKNSKVLAKGLFVMAEGMFIISSVTYTINDVKSEIHQFIDAIFDLIEVKR